MGRNSQRNNLVPAGTEPRWSGAHSTLRQLMMQAGVQKCQASAADLTAEDGTKERDKWKSSLWAAFTS